MVTPSETSLKENIQNCSFKVLDRGYADLVFKFLWEGCTERKVSTGNVVLSNVLEGMPGPSSSVNVLSNFLGWVCLAGIVDYMIEQAGPPSKQIQAAKQVQEFLKDGDDVIIIGVFSGETDKAYQLYQEAGKIGMKCLIC